MRVSASLPFFHLNHSAWTGIRQKNTDLLRKDNNDDEDDNNDKDYDDNDGDDDESNSQGKSRLGGDLDDDEESLANLLQPLGRVR